MNTNWQPIKFLIEIITMQMLVIGLAVSLVVAFL
jgi:hypothetical protein